jgi:murein L,D-transpeptidase YcbB/YkuD
LGVSGNVQRSAALKAACFDDRLVTAVAGFQGRHGLTADGVVGERTLAALNVPVEQRIRQIQLNLERWRWMPEDLGSRYVLVNIPGFQMQVVEAGQVVKTMRTIVGQKSRPTPVLSSKITYLEINPYWYVPSKIAREDLLPKIQENPSYLVRQNFRVFDSWDKDARELNPFTINWASLNEAHFPFRLRQEPAAHNALGRVKFMFPNELSVYIHDTPAKSLFKRSSRPFSSGCVRVEAPLELVALLLRHQDWDQARLAEAVASNQRQVVILDDPMPVHLVYLTAWVAAGGETHFREDIYGHDQTLLSALNESTATPLARGNVIPYPVYWGRL